MAAKGSDNQAKLAQPIIDRVARLVSNLPDGMTRLLWHRIALISEDPPNIALGLYLSCCGAQVELIAASEPVWNPARDPAVFDALTATLSTGESRLLLKPIRGINEHNFTSRWGFTCVQTDPDEAWESQLGDPYGVVLVDGIDQLLKTPREYLERLHAITNISASIEILARPMQFCGQQRLDEIRAQAVEIGFGVRHASQSMPEPGTPEVPGLHLGLVRLGAPLSDHPVLGHPQIMAHSQARLDLATRFVRGREVLDAGGWAGVGAQRYLEAGATRVVNLDISADALAQGRELHEGDDRVEFVQWDLNFTPLPFEDESFDRIVCLEVLEHIREQTPALAEFMRLLRPGGLLIVSVPDQSYEHRWAMINQCENIYHVKVPDRESFASMLAPFTDVKWYRQTDVVGSLVVADGREEKVEKGSFVMQEGWRVDKDDATHVVLAVCAKPLDESSSKKKPRRPTVPALASKLRVFDHSDPTVSGLRLHHRERESQVFRERYDWWRKCNALSDALGDVQAKVEDAEWAANEAERVRDASNEARKSAEAEQARLKTTVESLQKELAAAVASLEAAERERLAVANRLDEAADARDRLQTELARASAARDSIDADRKNIEAARDAVDADRKTIETERDRLRIELTNLRTEAESTRSALGRAEEQIARDESKLSDVRRVLSETEKRLASAETELNVSRTQIRSMEESRAKLMERLGRRITDAVDDMERRCLSVEAKLYDLEEDVVHNVPEVDVPPNGTSTTHEDANRGD